MKPRLPKTKIIDDFTLRPRYLVYQLLEEQKWDEALSALESTVDCYYMVSNPTSKTAEDSRNIDECRRLMAICHAQLGNRSARAGNWIEATEHIEKAINNREIISQQNTTETNLRDLAIDYKNLAIYFAQQNKFSEAIEHFNKAIEMWDLLKNKIPGDEESIIDCKKFLEDCHKKLEEQDKILRKQLESLNQEFQSLQEIIKNIEAANQSSNNPQALIVLIDTLLDGLCGNYLQWVCDLENMGAEKIEAEQFLQKITNFSHAISGMRVEETQKQLILCSFRRFLGRVHVHFGNYYRELDNFQEASNHFEKNLGYLLQSLQKNPEIDREIDREIRSREYDLYNLYFDWLSQLEHTTGKKCIPEPVRITEGIPREKIESALDEIRRNIADYCSQYGNLLAMQRDFKTASNYCQHAVTLLNRIFKTIS